MSECLAEEIRRTTAEGMTLLSKAMNGGKMSHSRKPRAVIYRGVTYRSIHSAAKALGTSNGCLNRALRKHGHYKRWPIAFADADSVRIGGQRKER